MSSVPPSAASLRGAVDLSSLVNRPAPGAPAPQAAGAPAAPGAPVSLPSLVIEGTDAAFSAFIELSNTVPVIVVVGASYNEPSTQLDTILRALTAEYAGRFVLVTVEADANPQLSQAFQAQTLPTVAAVVGGRPIGLFAGVHPADQVRDVIEQVLELAVQQGVTGVAVADDASDSAAAEPVEAPLPPHHAEAYDAIARGDFDEAIREYETAIKQDPRDSLAVAGLAQVSLLARLKDKTQAEIRNDAAARPGELEPQLLVADLDLSGGHVEDAFDRLLTLFPTLDQTGKNTVRARLIELFEVVGIDDPRVVKARARLTGLLY
ncbi:tetratricopeptide repeat protein [Agreia sp. PsM10]|jgi:putative thioredoxin|uniref:tetratricopeptide repeat protein n=1 Tax=Agreia sp. PsM10 TaxID=3030533 RepID=UPI00263B605C|nr:tetratricopeptide repeat protein [Agreia sp. PsM10]MDN4640280.1 tetratricopeptide repeat protein [Agreia sp. PsM10]